MQFYQFGIVCLGPALFTCLLPALLRYRLGVLARIGAAISITLMALSLLTGLMTSPYRMSSFLHHSSFAIFILFALAGTSVCAVGIHDRKRSAIAAMVAVLAMLVSVRWGYIEFVVLMTIGFVVRRFDPPTPADLRDPLTVAANNRTRRSRSIPRKLIREGRIFLVPLFYLLNLSELGREGIARSGSYEFADHIYRSIPSGATFLGRWIDQILLKMPASVALRKRYKQSQVAIRTALTNAGPDSSPFHVLAIPCGLPRDLTELAASLGKEDPPLLSRIEYVGMDVDPVLLTKARDFTADCGIPSLHFHQGNALIRDSYPAGVFHVAVSTGLGEFLNDAQLAVFYRNIYETLAPGGTFYTSASHSDPHSQWLLSAFELNAHYRTDEFLETILRQFPWQQLTIIPDPSGLQSFITAVKKV